MADGSVAVPPDSTGKKIATAEFTRADTTVVEIQRVELVDASEVQQGTASAPFRVDPTGTTTQPVAGAKSDNAGAPDATLMGVLAALANDAAPARTEGNLALLSVDRDGALRSVLKPMRALGVFSINARTPTYSGFSAATPLFSMRWGNASNLFVLLRFQVIVVTTVTASTAGLTERELVIARSFTASDTGGSSLLPSGNQQKRRSSLAGSLVTDMRIGAPVSAGSRTLDSAPIGGAAGWAPVSTTGMAIGSGGGSVGGGGWVDVYNILNPNEYPVVLAQNEGLVLRIGKDAQPSGATQQTYVQMTWAEVSAFP